MSESNYYKVYGPKPDDPNAKWHVSKVDCWYCLQPKAVTKKNRCYVPVRVQDHIDGSYMTFEEIEDKMTRCFGYFCSWQCSLGYCAEKFPHIAHKVHTHAKRNGFCGILEPTLDPRPVMQRFHPYLSLSESMTYDNLRPDPVIGKFMRYVPDNEQNTTKFAESRYVIEQLPEEVDIAKEFPQVVVDSEQLMDQLETIETTETTEDQNQTKNQTKKQKQTKKQTKRKSTTNPPKAKVQKTKAANQPKATKATKATNQTKAKIVDLVKETQNQPRLEDFFF
jgi:hypothetical protein